MVGGACAARRQSGVVEVHVVVACELERSCEGGEGVSGGSEVVVVGVCCVFVVGKGSARGWSGVGSKSVGGSWKGGERGGGGGAVLKNSFVVAVVFVAAV